MAYPPAPSETSIEKVRAGLEDEPTVELQRKGKALWQQLKYRDSRAAETTAEAIDRELERRGTHVWAGHRRGR